jgi:hypothetical protein
LSLLVESGLALGPCSCGLAVDQYDEYFNTVSLSTENPRAGSLRSAAAGAHSVQGLLTTVCESATLPPNEGHFSDEQKAIECGETLDDQEYGRASFFFFLTSSFHRDRRWRPTDAGIAAW